MPTKKTILFLFSLASALNLFAQVPANWQTAYQQLYLNLESLQTVLNRKWDGTTNSSIFSQDLFLANSNRGYEIFNPVSQPLLFESIDSTLSIFSEIGLKAVSINIQYPIMVKNFPNESKYRHFYEKIAIKLRENGFKILVSCQATFTDTVFGEAAFIRDVQRWYMGLTSDRYKQEKTQMLQTIINIMSPDYLTVEMEPLTQTANLNHKVDYNCDNLLAYVNYYLGHLHREKTLIGAGAGTWDDLDYFSKLASQTAIDYIDFHIYPINFNYFDDVVFKIDSLSQKYHKQLVIGEAWCYKATNQEMLTINNPVAANVDIFSRDMFDYWVPVDTMFIKAVISLSHFANVKLTSFFWPSLMFNYLSYTPGIHDSMSFAQRLRIGQHAGFDKMLDRNLSPIGEYLQDCIGKPNVPMTSKNNNKTPTFSLSQNFPNPFNPQTIFRFFLPQRQRVTISIHNVAGQWVRTLLDQEKDAGDYELTFDASNLASGTYFCCFAAGSVVETRKMILQR